MLNPETINRAGAGAHFVCIYDRKEDAVAHRRSLTREFRHDPNTRHRVFERAVKVDGAVVIVWCVTERRINKAEEGV